jgi:hypothetical protein
MPPTNVDLHRKTQQLPLGIILTSINGVYDKNRIIIKYGNIRDDSVTKLSLSQLEKKCF